METGKNTNRRIGIMLLVCGFFLMCLWEGIPYLQPVIEDGVRVFPHKLPFTIAIIILILLSVVTVLVYCFLKMAFPYWLRAMLVIGVPFLGILLTCAVNIMFPFILDFFRLAMVWFYYPNV